MELANWLAATTTATFHAAGAHVLRLTAQDGESSSYDDVIVTVVPGAPAGDGPQVALTAPADAATVTSPVDVTGSVSSDTLMAWRLEASEPSLGDDWQLLATGTDPVEGGVLGIFDPTMLLNGIYQIRLTAVDESGRSASDERSVVVRGNLKVGNFSVTFSDAQVPVSGIPIQVLRTYDSRNTHKGDFGVGWTLSVSGMRVSETRRLGKGWTVAQQPGFLPTYCVEPTRAKRVMVTLSDGRVFEFEPVVEDGCATFFKPDYVGIGFRPLPGTHATLALTNGGNAIVQGSELYDDIDFQILDPSRYTLTLPDGQELVIGDRTDSKPGLQSIRDRNGNVLTFGPSGITHSSGKAIDFERDESGRIGSITDARGNSLVYGYDPDGNLASVTDREGNLTRFVYDEDRPHYLRDIIDPRGVRVIRNEYDDDGRLVRSIDADDKVIEYTHNLAANQEIITDRTGAQRVLTYDNRGNVVTELDGEGGLVTRTFNAEDDRLTETVRQTETLSHTSSWEYQAGNVTEQANALGKTTYYTYNAWNQVLTTKDPLGNTTTNTYDTRNGNLLSTKDALQHATTFTYYPDGNLATRTDRLDRPTGYAYDSFGNLTSETDALGNVTSYTYDESGNRLTETRRRTKADGTQETLVTRFTYDKNGRLLSTMQPDGSVTSTTYNEAGLRDTSTDAAGRVTHYTYDDQGRLTHTLYPDGTSTSATYDEEGRRKTSTDRGGRVTTMEYDGVGRLKKTIYHDQTFTSTEYYLNGWVKSSTDARGHTTRYEYDAAGRQTRVSDAKDKATTFHLRRRRATSSPSPTPSTTRRRPSTTPTTGCGRRSSTTPRSAPRPTTTRASASPKPTRRTRRPGSGTTNWAASRP